MDPGGRDPGGRDPGGRDPGRGRRRQTYSFAIGLAAGAVVVGLVLPFSVDERDVVGRTAGGGVADAPIEGGERRTSPDQAGAVEAGAADVASGPGAGSTSSSASGVTAAGPTVAAGSAVTSSEVGVSDTSIKVGVLLADADVIARFGFQIEAGEPEEQYRVFFDEINDRGGIAGRQLEPVFAAFDPLQTSSARAACVRLTEDEKVFAIVTPFFSNERMLCVAEEHHTPLLMADVAIPESYHAKAPGLLFSTPMSAEGTLRNYAGDLDRLGALRGKKIGVVLDGATGDRAAVEAGLIATLQRLGYTITHTSIIEIGDAAGSQIPVEVQQMKTKGVEIVILVVNVVYATMFVQQAESQLFLPEYTTSDNSSASKDWYTQNMPSSFDGTLSITQFRIGEHRVGRPEAPDDASCRQRFDRAVGRSLTRGSAEYESVLMTCGLVGVFADALTTAGRALTRARFSAAMGELGPVGLPFMGGGSYAPGKQHGADFVRTMRWELGCRCYKPVDDMRRARFP